MITTMRNAYLILGPESSGTKMMTKLFCKAGCYGDDGDVQRLDVVVAGGDFPYIMESNLVFRRSVPHGKRYADIADIDSKFGKKGYIPKWIVLFREMERTAISAFNHGHKSSIEEARFRLIYELQFIGANLGHMSNFYLVSSSHLFQNPQRVLRGISKYAGIDLVPYTGIIEDVDSKYNI